jgi:hypothetical protein
MGAEQGRHDYEKESNSVRGIILANMTLWLRVSRFGKTTIVSGKRSLLLDGAICHPFSGGGGA